jgi:hypothetical protein
LSPSDTPDDSLNEREKVQHTIKALDLLMHELATLGATRPKAWHRRMSEESEQRTRELLDRVRALEAKVEFMQIQSNTIGQATGGIVHEPRNLPIVAANTV